MYIVFFDDLGDIIFKTGNFTGHQVLLVIKDVLLQCKFRTCTWNQLNLNPHFFFGLFGKYCFSYNVQLLIISITEATWESIENDHILWINDFRHLTHRCCLCGCTLSSSQTGWPSLHYALHQLHSAYSNNHVINNVNVFAEFQDIEIKILIVLFNFCVINGRSSTILAISQLFETYQKAVAKSSADCGSNLELLREARLAPRTIVLYYCIVHFNWDHP